jgi:Mrp family chromosome partitioning ATPase
MALQPCVVHNLWVLPSGRTSDEDIDTLHSGSVEDFLRTSDLVDYIIIDAAPVLSVADAMVLASQVDGVLIVVNARRLERDDAIWAREELDQVGARIVGIIATQARTGSRRRERAYGSRQALPPPREGKFEGGAAVPGQVPAGVVTGRLPGSNGQNGEDRDAQAWLQDGPAAGRGDPALPR